MKTLDQIEVGKTVRILRINGQGALRRRLFDMGLTTNIELYVRKVAPLRDPIEINVRNYELTLRKSEASLIEVE